MLVMVNNTLFYPPKKMQKIRKIFWTNQKSVIIDSSLDFEEREILNY